MTESHPEQPSPLPSDAPSPARDQQYPVRPPTGALPYGLGFLAYIPIPIVNFVITGIVMAAVYPSQKRHGGVAAENARRAANWGLTLIAVLVVAIALTLVLIPFVNGTDYSGVAAAPIVIIIPLAIAHLVIIITGLVKANRGAVFMNPLALPFIRAQR